MGPGAPLLILFHGTGGAPRQFIELGEDLMPGAHLVAPAGDVLEHGVPRFFKRREEGVYDMEDLARANKLVTGFLRTRALFEEVDPICFSPYLYRARNRVERSFNRIKQCRRVATRYDGLAANYLAFVQLASIRLWLRLNESAS